MGAHSQQAYVPWSALKADILLLALGVIVLLICGIADVRVGCSQWFHRSGAVSVLLGGILAYRSLLKHYAKLFNLPLTGTSLRTSRNQTMIDRCTLALSVVGTFVWGYGDMFFKVACK